MGPFSIMFARFPYGGTDRIDVTDWLVSAVVNCKLDPRVSSVYHAAINDTPITMSRNKAVEMAKAAKADYLVMIDSDMKPDAYLSTNKNCLDVDPVAKPFWESSWDFMLFHRERGPCMIGAPYCGPSPHQNVYVFRWATFQNDHPNADLRIEQYTREESVERLGFEEVACLPTGLVIIDMRVFDNPLVSAPYFTYEYTDKFEYKKASTEDCVFTRDLNMANIPLYVNWDAWAGHWKQQCVGRPKPIYREQVHAKFVKAVLDNVSAKRKFGPIERDQLPDFDKDPDDYICVHGWPKSDLAGPHESDLAGPQDHLFGSKIAEALPENKNGIEQHIGEAEQSGRIDPVNFQCATGIPRPSSPIGVFGLRASTRGPDGA